MNHRTRSSRGFTLLELLITMAITVVIVFAIVRVFDIIGGNIVDGRAVLEMNGQLRGATMMVENDLSQVTAALRPWPEIDGALGYFEYIEGLGHDLAPLVSINANQFEWAAITPPGLTIPDNSIGDFDDTIMFTTRSTGKPFRGQILGGIRRPNRSSNNPNLFVQRNEIDDGRLIVDPNINGGAPTTIESNVAEIIWWTSVNDTNGNNTVDSDDVITLHRRVMLVRPDLDLYMCLDSEGNTVNGEPSPDGNLERVPIVFFNNFDISAHAIPANSNTGASPRMVSNSLSDLSRRQNRFGHDPRIVDIPLLDRDAGNYPRELFPYPVYREVLNALVQRDQFFDQQYSNEPDSNQLPHLPVRFTDTSITLNQPQRGRDVVLTSLGAFDVKAYDPLAPLLADEPNLSVSNRALAPGDRGWDLNNVSSRRVGRGAFVNLNYLAPFFPTNSYTGGVSGVMYSSLRYPEERLSLFSGVPVFRNAPQFNEGNALYLGIGPRITASAALNNAYSYSAAVYDTWSMYYERDGVNQDLDSDTDEGVDGIDQDNQFGPDDVAERETSPPYPVPLRGLKVTLRLLEKDTRQVGQMSVSIDFTPE